MAEHKCTVCRLSGVSTEIMNSLRYSMQLRDMLDDYGHDPQSTWANGALLCYPFTKNEFEEAEMGFDLKAH